MRQVKCYDIFEIRVHGKVQGNPFVDGHLTGVFEGRNERKQIRGFYDGDNTYVVRFMPSFEGEYHYKLTADFALDEAVGSFEVLPAGAGSHGMVRTASQFHFAYEDGTRYYPIGTTCYVWHLQSETLQDQTVETLAASPFNKLRFCVFPKHFLYNLREPESYPYELREDSPWKPEDYSPEFFESASKTPFGGISVSIDEPEKVWDFERFNPKYFRHIETCVRRLMDLGIEADIILFHPYDRWGYSKMGPDNEKLYLEYIVARLASFRNVWWSMANEYDLFFHKKIADWENNAAVLVKEDPYCHLRSIHNCMKFYDYTRPWITHSSIQRVDLYKTAENTIEWRERYGKPVVLDEIAYEGNIAYGWGNISGEEMTRRFWEAYTRGGYGGHGETYTHPEDILWWSHGGTLHGSSPERIAFLKKIMDEAPGNGLEPAPAMFDETVAADSTRGQGSYYLYYFGANRPSERSFRLPENKKYQAQIIDTWDMTVTDCGTVQGNIKLKLPGKPYIAVRFRATE